jgi:HEPN domain-containing protein
MLLQASAEDETTMLLEGIPDLAFGFHAQRAIEKMLKALLAARGEKYLRIHHLEKLAAMLGVSGEALPAVPVDLEGLTLYALDYRYGEPPPVELPAREKTIATVRIIREFVHRRVQELDQSS